MKNCGKRIAALLLLICFWTAGCAAGAEAAEAKETGTGPAGEPTNGVLNEERQTLGLSRAQIQTQRLSPQRLRLTWPDTLDGQVETYFVKRCEVRRDGQPGEWALVGEIASDGSATGAPVTFLDALPEAAAKQFLYVIDLEPRDSTKAFCVQSQPVLASNLMVCIDPGHYAGVNQIENGYTEGDAMLCLGETLRAELKENYGIDSCMTRTDGTITLGGYSDESLDSAHLSLRGAYAGEAACDLFVSLHSNANEDHANGYPTCAQPIGINKPVLLLNEPACESETALRAANAIGAQLAQASFQCGVGATAAFEPALPHEIKPWTEAYNDGLDLPGSVFLRRDREGREYYGVLRGAAEVGVPGIIIEHGMHTVPEVRKAAVEGDLLTRWAEADARGIAQGFGFLACAALS